MPFEKLVMSEVTVDLSSGIWPLRSRITFVNRRNLTATGVPEPAKPNSLEFVINCVTTVVERGRQLNDVAGLRIGIDIQGRQVSAGNLQNFRPMRHDDLTVRRRESFAAVEMAKVPAPGLAVLVVEPRMMR